MKKTPESLVKTKEKVVIGRTELVSFPELGIDSIEAKIDTGAYSTAIHAPEFWTQMEEEKEVLYFKLLSSEKESSKNDLIYKTTSFYRKKVRSSNGRLEERFMLRTKLLLGGISRITHLSLTNREKMKYPILIGRRVLKKGYIVDVSKQKIHFTKK